MSPYPLGMKNIHRDKLLKTSAVVVGHRVRKVFHYLTITLHIRSTFILEPDYQIPQFPHSCTVSFGSWMNGGFTKGTYRSRWAYKTLPLLYLHQPIVCLDATDWLEPQAILSKGKNIRGLRSRLGRGSRKINEPSELS